MGIIGIDIGSSTTKIIEINTVKIIFMILFLYLI